MVVVTAGINARPTCECCARGRLVNGVIVGRALVARVRY